MRAMRAFALWLGLAALSVQAMAPLCLAGFMPSSESAGSFPIVLCAAHGIRTLYTDGNNQSQPPSPDDQNSCPLCSAVAQVANFTAPGPILMLLPIAIGLVPESSLARPMRLARRAASYTSRAPPPRTFSHHV
jgi:hypothetical protein